MSDEQPVPITRPAGGSIGKGVVITIGMNVVLAAFGGLLAAMSSPADALGFVILMGIGLAQSVWAVPMILNFRKRRESETVKGILIMASIVFLLNAGCWGLGLTLLGPGSFR